MNCELACHLMDDYLENRLGRQERQTLELHLARCPSCAAELRSRPAMNRRMSWAMAVSVQHLHLSSGASSRIVKAAQDSALRGIRSKRTVLTLQLAAGTAGIVLVTLAVLVLLGRLPGPGELSLLTRPSASRPGLSLTRNDILIEPWDLRPGEPFTTTVFLHSDLSQSIDTVRFQLDISGPTGDYRFVLAFHGPFPAHGVSILRVTPDLLEAPCRERYNITPAEIVGAPGVYTVRATLLNSVATPKK